MGAEWSHNGYDKKLVTQKLTQQVQWVMNRYQKTAKESKKTRRTSTLRNVHESML